MVALAYGKLNYFFFIREIELEIKEAFVMEFKSERFFIIGWYSFQIRFLLHLFIQVTHTHLATLTVELGGELVGRGKGWSPPKNVSANTGKKMPRKMSV